MATQDDQSEYLIAPDLSRRGLSRAVDGIDQDGNERAMSVVEERPLTIFLNAQEIVTAMTIGDYPEYLALGFLRNQGMLQDDADVTGVSYDEELETVVVRTATQTSYEDKLKKKTRTSGCAVGTVFGDMMEGLEEVHLPASLVKTSWLYALKSTERPACIWMLVRSMARCCVAPTGRWSIWKMSDATMRSTKLPAGW